MKTFTLSFYPQKPGATKCVLPSMAFKYIKALAGGDLRLGMPSKVNGRCWQEHLLVNFESRPMTVDGKFPDLFIWTNPDGGKYLSRDLHLRRTNCLIHVNTAAGEWSTTNGHITRASGFVKILAQGMGIVGNNGSAMTYQDAIIEMAPDSVAQIVGTDGSKWAVKYDGQIVTTEVWDETKYSFKSQPRPVRRTEFVPRHVNVIDELGAAFDEALAEA